MASCETAWILLQTNKQGDRTTRFRLIYRLTLCLFSLS